MLIRLWRTGVEEGRVDDLVRFAHDRSLPMFQSHEGCLGVLFAGGSDDGFLTVTLWPDADAITDLERSESYRAVVAEIMTSGLLAGEQTTQVLEVHGGWWSATAFAIGLPFGPTGRRLG